MEQVDQVDYRGKPRRLFQTVNEEPSLTVQSDRKAADIQEIIKKYQAGGLGIHLDQVERQFVDITAFQDYADAMRYAKLAEGEFMKLPAKVRRIFHNDVAEWLDSAHDPEKRDALVEAGFIKAAEVPPAPVEPVPEAGEAGGTS